MPLFTSAPNSLCILRLSAIGDVCNTIALNYGLEVDANQNGMPVTVTLGGANATGTIVLSMQYVTD